MLSFQFLPFFYWKAAPLSELQEISPVGECFLHFSSCFIAGQSSGWPRRCWKPGKVAGGGRPGQGHPAGMSLDVTPASSHGQHQHSNVMLQLLRCFLRSLPAADELGAVSVQRHFTVVTLEQNNSCIHLSKCLQVPFPDWYNNGESQIKVSLSRPL